MLVERNPTVAVDQPTVAFEQMHQKLIVGECEGADPEDPDGYYAGNCFWVPREARWEFLQENAKQPSIGKLIDDAMVAVERDNTLA